MEDLAPAERLRINQAIANAEQEARQKMIEDMIAAERERDPDALDEDIISKVNKEVQFKKMNAMSQADTTTNLEPRRKHQPAIALGTTIATTK